jgi:hypothetical protein
MKLELIFVLITGFIIYNAHTDGKLLKMVFKYKKYYSIIFYVFLMFSLYLMIRHNPARTKNLLLHANNVIKTLPVDKSSISMLSPILDFTGNNIMNDVNWEEEHASGAGDGLSDSIGNIWSTASTAEKRLLQSGGGGGSGGGNKNKRSVSETKKKYVASLQDWKCGDCKEKLNAWFEVDHKVRLEHGGTNSVENLVAMCRNCHGKKTAFENMK